MTFHVGQKVECIDASGRFWPNNLVRGRIYIVAEVGPHPNGPWCKVEGTDSGSECGFFQRRFRPIVDRSTDISIFTAMLTPNKERV